MGTGYNGAGAPEEGDARQDMGTFWAKPLVFRFRIVYRSLLLLHLKVNKGELWRRPNTDSFAFGQRQPGQRSRGIAASPIVAHDVTWAISISFTIYRVGATRSLALARSRCIATVPALRNDPPCLAPGFALLLATRSRTCHAPSTSASNWPSGKSWTPTSRPSNLRPCSAAHAAVAAAAVAKRT